MNKPGKRIALRVKEAAEMLGISERTCYDLIYKGELPSLKIGRAIRIPMDLLQRHITERTTGGNGKAA